MIGAAKRNCVVVKSGAWYPTIVFILVCLWIDIDFVTALEILVMERAARVVHHLYDAYRHDDRLA